MKAYRNRIIVILSLVFVFIVLYTAVSLGLNSKDIEYAHFVNLEGENYRNFLVLGTDKDETRTDLILLCQYNEIDNKLNVLQIPRDTKVENKRTDKKINSAYGSKNGIKTVKNEVEILTGIYPENYFVVNFSGFRQLIDAIGGVEFNVPINMKYDDPVQALHIDIKKGYQTLDGEKAEMFMRFRQNNDKSGYSEGDIGRLKAHKSFYQATIDKLLSFDGIFNIGEIIKATKNNIKTDFTLVDLFKYMGDIKKLSKDSVQIFMLPGSGKYVSEDGKEISYYIPNTIEIEKLQDKYF